VRRAPRPAWLSRPPRTVLDANANAARSIQHSTRWDGGAGLHLRLRALVLSPRPRGEGEGEGGHEMGKCDEPAARKTRVVFSSFSSRPPSPSSIHPSIIHGVSLSPPLIPYHASSENGPYRPRPRPHPFPLALSPRCRVLALLQHLLR
jgi:hypothetical protein